MKRSTLNPALKLLLPLLVLALTARAEIPSELKTGAFNPPRLAPDFTLRGSNGSDFNLSSYRGKVVALGFGYTSCPDVCPTTLFYLAQAREQLGAAGKDFQVVYVTVDPERDSPERLRRFLADYDPTFVGATGAPERLADVRKAYGIVISRQSVVNGQSNYFIHHSAFVYLIDRKGNLRAMMPFGVSVEDIVHDVKALLGK